MIYIYIYIYLGKFNHDLTVLPKPGIMVYFRGIIAKWPNISGELLQCAQTFAIKTIDFTMKNIQT